MSTDSVTNVWKITTKKTELIVEKIVLGHGLTSLDETSKFLPEGAYTTFRTYSHKKAMRIEDHFQRLDESAERANASFHPHSASIRPVLRDILNESPFTESRVRITLDLEKMPGSFYVTLEELHLPSVAAYQKGVKTVSRTMQRENPKAKLTQFLTTTSRLRAQLPPGVNEMLMVDPDGIILEGLSSNFFGVKGGAIFTVEEGVLPGITRKAVVEIAVSEGIPVITMGIPLSQLDTLEECFITSASRGVLPVVQVDNAIIYNGKPGKLSRKLIQLFNLWVENNVNEM